MSTFIAILTGVFLVICTATDIKYRLVYLKILLPFMVSGIIFQIISRSRSFPDIIGGVLVGVSILIINRLTNGSIGYGDGLVLMVTGCFLGLFGNLRLLTVAMFFSGIFSAGLLILRKCGRKTEIPFVPFLLLSFLLM